MWKKAVFLAVGILAVVSVIAGTISTVNAQGNTSPGIAQWRQGGGPGGPGGPFGPGVPGGPGGDEIMNRVAQILNIDKQKLTDAFKQAGQEMSEERFDDMFAKWVTDGKLTQEQADQYKAWLEAKPAGVPGFGAGGVFRGSEMMDKLLKDGKITQAQYDAWKQWIGQKPSFDFPKPEKPAGAPPCDKPARTR